MEAVRKLAATQGVGAMCATMSDEGLLAMAKSLVGYRGPDDTRKRVLAAARTLAATMGIDLDATLTAREMDELWALLTRDDGGGGM